MTSQCLTSKVKQAQGELAGAQVARGEAELGFQQMGELLPEGHGAGIKEGRDE
jgi:hypothetical protein